MTGAHRTPDDDATPAPLWTPPEPGERFDTVEKWCALEDARQEAFLTGREELLPFATWAQWMPVLVERMRTIYRGEAREGLFWDVVAALVGVGILVLCTLLVAAWIVEHVGPGLPL